MAGKNNEISQVDAVRYKEFFDRVMRVRMVGRCKRKARARATVQLRNLHHEEYHDLMDSAYEEVMKKEQEREDLGKKVRG